ncbi:MAG: DUF4064 domain-containing protein [Halobacteriota archaeon]
MANETNEEVNAAFLLSLIGGLFILIGGLVALVIGMYGAFGMGYGYMGSMMGRMMGGFGPVWVFGGATIIAVSIIGIASAVVVIYGAFSVRDRPTARTTWGALILAFSLVSLLSLGGFLVGAILGILGGILAMVGNR